jgi:glutathione synthase
MVMRVGVQMDPIEKIDISGDSTFALMLEAQARGHELFCYSPGELHMRGGQVYAHGQWLQVRDERGDHFHYLGERERVELAGLDLVLLRQDPPFDMAYVTSTHILENIGGGTRVINDPFHVRNAPEKLFVLQFDQYCPETLITRSREEARAFRREHGEIIVKPLYGNGGAGVFHILPGDGNLASLIEMFHDAFREPFIVQQYLPAVREGDKRIILIDGEPAGALNRIPAQGEARSNMHVGGRPELCELTEREHEICAAIGPELKRRGLFFTGIDVIGGMLTEINVTSPTGIREIKRFGGPDIAALFWDRL